MHQRTEGVPLAVEELVRLMADRADLARRDGGWMRRNLAEIAVPQTVRDAVLERAGRLSAQAQAMLQSAAVLAEPADEAALIAVSGLSLNEARSGLAEAMRSGLLARTTVSSCHSGTRWPARPSMRRYAARIAVHCTSRGARARGPLPGAAAAAGAAFP